MTVPAAIVRLEDRSTVEEQQPRNSYHQVCYVFAPLCVRILIISYPLTPGAVQVVNALARCVKFRCFKLLRNKQKGSLVYRHNTHLRHLEHSMPPTS